MRAWSARILERLRLRRAISAPRSASVLSISITSRGVPRGSLDARQRIHGHRKGGTQNVHMCKDVDGLEGCCGAEVIPGGHVLEDGEIIRHDHLRSVRGERERGLRRKISRCRCI